MDEIKFKNFYDEQSKNLWWYICKTTGDKTIADDIFQEVMIRLLNSVPDNLNEFQVKAFAYTTASRLVNDNFRKNKRKNERFQDTTDAAYIDSGNTEDKGDLALDFEKAFSRLNIKEKNLLWMAYVDNYEHREISKILNLNEKSIKVLLFRAKNKLAGIMKNLGIKL